MAMRWRKYDLWKAGIIVGVVLLFLMLTIVIPISAAVAHEGVSGSATPGSVTVQATLTADATLTTLNKQKLEQEIQQLKDQNNPDLLGWLRMNAAILISTLVVVIGGLIGLFRWFGDRRSEREKRAEERFQAAVTGLGGEKEEAKIGAAILLRTFLRPGHEQFYTQTFDLAVAHLRLPRTARLQEEDPDALHTPSQAGPDTPWQLTILRQALTMVFKEAFPLARLSSGDSNNGEKSLQSLDATGIQLDHAYLKGVDLRRVWMPRASLQNVDLSEANLTGANLTGANLTRANLFRANLHEADLIRANLNRAILSMANLSKAYLHKANLHGAYLRGANLGGANLEDALSLKDTDLLGVKGLTKEQLEACKARGAIIDEDITAKPSQPTVSPPPPAQTTNVQAPTVVPVQTVAPPLSQNKETQVPLDTPTQVNTPPPSIDGSNSASSQPSTEP